MPLTNTQYDIILRDYENRQLKNRHEAEQRAAYVYDHVPGYRELDESVAAVSVSQGKKYLAGDEQAMEELKLLISELSFKKARLLKEAGLPEDYLKPVHTCPDCRDTGYIDGQKCHCFKQAMISLLYEQSNIREMLQHDNFQSLSYEYYEGEDLSRFKKAVITCQNFIKNFNSDYHNLFFYGTVGTGKTFLSNCAAKELIESGHSVIYFSAAGLFDLLSRYSFDYKSKEDERERYADLYQCDLLIVDDLGTELTNQFVASRLFSLLNQRHMGKKATVISTNLSLEELRDRYSDRIFSRITSHYELCKLTGPDIRMYKKRLSNRK
ncbi:MAG: ATP-binding protein [Lachnospiraceae bacterium]|nr:ATP-binding protein [Lachnospiraceae bacterium]MDE7019984.1 ATP-binding protein [Lachnospiraceae bacterium]